MSSAAGAYWKPAWTRNVTLSDGSLVEDSVVLPEGFTAGIDAEHDRARFHVATVLGPRCDGGIGKNRGGSLVTAVP